MHSMLFIFLCAFSLHGTLQSTTVDRVLGRGAREAVQLLQQTGILHVNSSEIWCIEKRGGVVFEGFLSSSQLTSALLSKKYNMLNKIPPEIHTGLFPVPINTSVMQFTDRCTDSDQK